MSVVTSSGTWTDTAQQTPVNLPGTVTPVTVNNTLSYTFANGTAADQVTKLYVATLTLSAAATVLNLFDNSSGTQITDVYGTAISLTVVRKLYIKNKSTVNTEVLLLGSSGTVSNTWTGLFTNPGQITIEPSTASGNGGGCVFVAPNTAGWVVSTSSKLFRLDPGAATFNVDIEILGI